MTAAQSVPLGSQNKRSDSTGQETELGRVLDVASPTGCCQHAKDAMVGTT